MTPKPPPIFSCCSLIFCFVSPGTWWNLTPPKFFFLQGVPYEHNEKRTCHAHASIFLPQNHGLQWKVTHWLIPEKISRGTILHLHDCFRKSTQKTPAFAEGDLHVSIADAPTAIQIKTHRKPINSFL